MSAQHTPGPWVWDGDYTLRPAQPDPTTSATHTILSEDGPRGFLGGDHRAVAAEFQSNRRLIAAAPDLLEALQVAAEALCDLPLMDPRIVAIRTAIARATGADA